MTKSLPSARRKTDMHVFGQIRVFDGRTYHVVRFAAARVSSRENLSSEFPHRSATNRAVQPQKMARGLKFWI